MAPRRFLSWLRIALFVFLFAAVSSREASAFFKLRAVKPKYDIHSWRDANYLVLFSRTGNKRTRTAPNGKRVREFEISYKLTDEADPPGKIFGGAQWGEIRFFDGEDFEVARDTISQYDFFAKKEYYGAVWVEKSSAERIAKVSIRGIEDPGFDNNPAAGTSF